MTTTATRQLAELVRTMRAAQRLYFRDKTPQNLSKAKELERRVDQECKRILDSQKELF